MKKVTFTFVVSDEVVEEMSNELSFGNYGSAATICEESAEDINYSIEEYEG